MIFRIRLPRLEELLGLDRDDSEREDIRKPHNPNKPHFCGCACATGYELLNVTFYGSFTGD